MGGGRHCGQINLLVVRKQEGRKGGMEEGKEGQKRRDVGGGGGRGRGGERSVK